MKRDRSKPRKDKHLLVDEDVVDGQISPDNLLKDYLDSQAGGSSGEHFNLDGLFEFDFDTTQITLRSVTLIKRGSDLSHVSLVNRLDLVSQRLVCRQRESVDRWSIKTSTDTPLPTSIDSQLRTSIDGF
ncbi:hypothetical protein YC2023_072553 [Brassica napus]